MHSPRPGRTDVRDRAAVAPFAPLPSSAFKLNIDRTPDYDAYGDAIRAVESRSAVTRASPLDVATSRQHVGRAALCHNTGLDGSLMYDGFCWDTADDNTSAYAAGGGWHPQGLTAAHEYGHVLLVRPVGDDFKAVAGVHADGIAWYDNKLFVANGESSSSSTRGTCGGCRRRRAERSASATGCRRRAITSGRCRCRAATTPATAAWTRAPAPAAAAGRAWVR